MGVISSLFKYCKLRRISHELGHKKRDILLFRIYLVGHSHGVGEGTRAFFPRITLGSYASVAS